MFENVYLSILIHRLVVQAKTPNFLNRINATISCFFVSSTVLPCFSSEACGVGGVVDWPKERRLVILGRGLQLLDLSNRVRIAMVLTHRPRLNIFWILDVKLNCLMFPDRPPSISEIDQSVKWQRI